MHIQNTVPTQDGVIYEDVTVPSIGGIPEHSYIRKMPEGSSIPKDENNGQYRIYLDWLSQGNTPTQVTL